MAPGGFRMDCGWPKAGCPQTFGDGNPASDAFYPEWDDSRQVRRCVFIILIFQDFSLRRGLFHPADHAYSPESRGSFPGGNPVTDHVYRENVVCHRFIWSVPGSIDLDAGRCHHFFPARDLPADDGGEFIGRGTDRLGAFQGENLQPRLASDADVPSTVSLLAMTRSPDPH